MTEREINYFSKVFTVRKINDDDIKNPFNFVQPKMLIIARSGGGKSFVIRSILRDFRKLYNSGLVISKTEKLNRFFSKFFPNAFIEFKYDR
jgi:hypothetical protein